MKHPETQSSPSAFIGYVKNGVVILDSPVALKDGQAVRVEPIDQGEEAQFDAERAERVCQLQQLFSEWTEEDGKLSDEEAGRLHVALDQNRGLGLRSPLLD